jgi:D-3-phosphoglycerate dehydrogenase
MRPGSILINTAREEIWDKQAVIDGVKSGKLFGVGIETPILTPIPKDDPYLQYSNILVNPHNAFNTTEADKRVKDTWVENIISFCQGNPVRVVNGV